MDRLNKNIIYEELKKFNITETSINELWENDLVKIHLFLIKNIKDTINENYIIQECEWKFYIKKLKFLEKIINNLNIKKNYKIILMHNVKQELNKLGVN